ESAEHHGELERDVAAPHEDHRARALLEEEDLVGGDAEVVARDVEAIGLTAGGDEDLLPAQPALADLERVRIDEAREPVDDLHAGVSEQALVDAVEARDLAVLVGDERREVVLHALD